MFIMSVKQLLRKPGSMFLFFSLLASSTALLIFAIVSMVACGQRIDIVESQFTTIATVTQNAEPGDGILKAEILEFDSPDYIVPPETRPFLLAYNPQLYTTNIQYTADSIHIVEFSPLESEQMSNNSVPVKIEKIYYNDYDRTSNTINNLMEKDLEPGDIISIRQEQGPVTLLEPGKRYIANLSYNQQDEYSPYFGPFSTQYDAQGRQISDGGRPRIEEVTKDFWLPGSRGEIWMNWVEAHQWEKNTTALPVLPTNSLNVLPSFHSKNAYINDGREITQEEFAGGAKVCMLPQSLMARNILSIGDKIRLPLRCALYGYVPNGYKTLNFNCGYFFTPLDANGDLYEPFWEEEYEIVGSYKQLSEENNELTYDVIIVPRQSVEATWDDCIAYYEPMNGLNASFQIPNGTIAKFNASLHFAAPAASKLEIIYHDNGYENIMSSLLNTRLSSMLLLSVGCLAIAVVIILLLYFFVVREKRRTAIERSLGMTRVQCYISSLSGIFLLALLAVATGSGIGWTVMHTVMESQLQKPSTISLSSTAADENDESAIPAEEREDIAYFSREYSLWAENEQFEIALELDTEAVSIQNRIYYATPLLVLSVFTTLAFILTRKNLKIEPIILLGGG